MLRPILLALTLAAGASWIAAAEPPAPDPLAWPAVTRDSRPWTRWWWLGSAVDAANLTRELTLFRDAGLGGVEICPIYGAKGYEDRFLPFLSPQWMAMLSHTTVEAKRLALGIDLTTGTGWPFGGPSVMAEDASSGLLLKRYAATGGARFGEKFPEGHLQYLLAVSSAGEHLELTDKVSADGQVDWVAPAGEWQLYAAVQRNPIQKVKRAAPGGEGNVLDPYSVAALGRYLAVFDRAFAEYRGQMPSGHFHDSFEYYGATWTNDFFREFADRRGYDLRTQLPALFGDGPKDTAARVRSDYRETLSDLHLAYIARWTEWCHRLGGVSRNQAHGSPTDWLDVYAAADIPETEIFRKVDERQMPQLKLSSSAAHLKGTTLASAEAFTWLGEHFHVSLAQAKQAADFLFLAGVNRLVLHGIPYSPADTAWPGWQFYAAVNFGPQGGLWHDLPDFNAYLTRCQSVLQAGAPDNDVLLYIPIYDVWHASGELFNQDPIPQAFVDAGNALGNSGYAYDVVSDRFLDSARVVDRRVLLGSGSYRAVVVPRCRLMPATTLARLRDLAQGGIAVVFLGGPPEDVPGFGALEARRADFRKTLGALRLADDTPAYHAPYGHGLLLSGTDLDVMLAEARVVREPMVASGLRCVRRTHATGRYYFIANRSGQAVDEWVPLGTPAECVVILDPRLAGRTGVAALRTRPDGRPEVRLQLQPGESCVLRTSARVTVKGRPWPILQAAGEAFPITGTWRVEFVDGGPVLPAGFETRTLASWTTLGDDDAQRFAGTARYTIEFDAAGQPGQEWVLDLGTVKESARVRLNGHSLATLWTPPFQVPVGTFLRQGTNLLEVEVTNLAANRVRDLDQRGVNWKYFYDINVVDIEYRPLDASNWPLMESGLLGPVTLRRTEPERLRKGAR
jgi:hypothetical protein